MSYLSHVVLYIIKEAVHTLLEEGKVTCYGVKSVSAKLIAKELQKYFIQNKTEIKDRKVCFLWSHVSSLSTFSNALIVDYAEVNQKKLGKYVVNNLSEKVLKKLYSKVHFSLIGNFTTMEIHNWERQLSLLGCSLQTVYPIAPQNSDTIFVETVSQLLQGKVGTQIDPMQAYIDHQLYCARALIKKLQQLRADHPEAYQKIDAVLKRILKQGILIGHRHSINLLGADRNQLEQIKAQDVLLKKMTYQHAFTDCMPYFSRLSMEAFGDFLRLEESNESLASLEAVAAIKLKEIQQWEAELQTALKKPASITVQVKGWMQKTGQIIYQSSLLGLIVELSYLLSSSLAEYFPKKTRLPKEKLLIGFKVMGGTLGIVCTYFAGFYGFLRTLVMVSSAQQLKAYLAGEIVDDATARVNLQQKIYFTELTAFIRLVGLTIAGVEGLVTRNPSPLISAVGGMAGSMAVVALTQKNLLEDKKVLLLLMSMVGYEGGVICAKYGEIFFSKSVPVMDEKLGDGFCKAVEVNNLTFKDQFSSFKIYIEKDQLSKEPTMPIFPSDINKRAAMAEQFPAVFDLNTLNGANGFTVLGIQPTGYFGNAVSTAGDLNGDGVNDLVVGAELVNSSNGTCYVIFGGRSGFPANFNLATLNGANGFTIPGITDAGRLGLSVAMGDINGDKITDLVVGAPLTNFYSGAAYVVFGSRNGFPANFNLATLNGVNGFTVSGTVATEALGIALSVGDINGDGIADVIIGARGTSTVYVIFGSGTSFPAAFNLANLNGINGFTIVGTGELGGSLNAGGDLNADGIVDLVAGAPSALNSNGTSYVIFGNKLRGGFPAMFNVTNLNGNNGFAMLGLLENGNLGDFVNIGGDINGDGIADLVVGASAASSDSGFMYVIYGSRSSFPAFFNLMGLDGSDGFMIPPVVLFGALGDAATAGDINGDGIVDLVVGTPGANIENGTTYVVYGRGSFPGVFNLSELDGTNGFTIYGIVPRGLFGTPIDTAGDINDDGIKDIVIGAQQGGEQDAGAVYVIFGRGPNTTFISNPAPTAILAPSSVFAPNSAAPTTELSTSVPVGTILAATIIPGIALLAAVAVGSIFAYRRFCQPGIVRGAGPWNPNQEDNNSNPENDQDADSKRCCTIL